MVLMKMGIFHKVSMRMVMIQKVTTYGVMMRMGTTDKVTIG